MDDYQLRPVNEDEYLLFHRCFGTAFNKDPQDDEAKLEREIFDLDRTLAAFHPRDGVVGTTVSMGRELEIPGGAVPAAHVTLVSVAATHRRRGLLTRLMDRQLTELRAAGTEPVAVLWASEEIIYGRYGYGPATATVSYEANNRDTGVVMPGPPTGELREVDYRDTIGTLSAVFDTARAGRPGYSARSDALWRFWGADLEHWRRGRTEMRTVLHERDGTADGYALYRIERSGGASGPASTVHVEEMVATDTAAYRELWRYLFSVDLTRWVEYGNAAVDEPLQHMVTERPRLGARLGGGLWLRILDLPAALTARRYAAPVDVVLSVADAQLGDNAGRCHLRGDAARASCQRTDAPADLSLGTAELGAAYLGGTTLAALAAAGRVSEQRPGALAATSTAFGWHRAPVSIEIF
ncbi:MAG: GNAT family N-acetyltransferase [Actinocatenispora sp.]